MLSAAKSAMIMNGTERTPFLLRIKSRMQRIIGAITARSSSIMKNGLKYPALKFVIAPLVRERITPSATKTSKIAAIGNFTSGFILVFSMRILLLAGTTAPIFNFILSLVTKNAISKIAFYGNFRKRNGNNAVAVI